MDFLNILPARARAIYISMTQLFSAAKYERRHLAIKVDEMQTSFRPEGEGTPSASSWVRFITRYTIRLMLSHSL